MKDKIDKLNPMEKFKVINDLLKIRVTSGVRYFASDDDGGTARFLGFTKKVDKKKVEAAVDHMLANKGRTVKKTFSEERQSQIKRIFEGVEDNGWINKKDTYKKYLNEATSLARGKPRKGQMVLTLYGKTYKILEQKSIYIPSIFLFVNLIILFN